MKLLILAILIGVTSAATITIQHKNCLNPMYYDVQWSLNNARGSGVYPVTVNTVRQCKAGAITIHYSRTRRRFSTKTETYTLRGYSLVLTNYERYQWFRLAKDTLLTRIPSPTLGYKQLFTIDNFSTELTKEATIKLLDKKLKRAFTKPAQSAIHCTTTLQLTVGGGVNLPHWPKATFELVFAYGRVAGQTRQDTVVSGWEEIASNADAYAQGAILQTLLMLANGRNGPFSDDTYGGRRLDKIFHVAGLFDGARTVHEFGVWTAWALYENYGFMSAALDYKDTLPLTNNNRTTNITVHHYKWVTKYTIPDNFDRTMLTEEIIPRLRFGVYPFRRIAADAQQVCVYKSVEESFKKCVARMKTQ